MKTDAFASELDRLDALLKWWGAPKSGHEKVSHAHLQRFDAIVSELERAVVEITESQEQALTQSQDLLVQSLPIFVNGRDLDKVMAAQSKILLSLFDAASTQVKTWVNFAEKIRNAQLALAASELEAPEATDSGSNDGAAQDAEAKPAPPHRGNARSA